MIRNKLVNKNLSNYQVFEENPEITSKYFNVTISPEFTIGRWSFLIDPPDGLLKIGTNVLIEMIDSSGNPIWIDFPKSNEIVKYTEDGHILVLENPDGNSDGYLKYLTSLIVTVDVYDTVSPGPAKLTILANAVKIYDTVNNVYTDPPKDWYWENYYNIKYQTTVNINTSPLSKNTSDLIFKTTPSANITEINRRYYTEVSSSNLITVSGSSMYVSLETEKYPIKIERPLN